MTIDHKHRRPCRSATRSAVLALTLVGTATVTFAPDTIKAQMLPDTGSKASASKSRNSDSESDNQQNDTNKRAASPDAGAAVSDYRFQPVSVRDDSSTPQIALTSKPTVVVKAPPPPNEFETFVQFHVGKRLSRFGNDLLLPDNRDYAVANTAAVPPDYLLNVGDVISISMAGSIEGSVEREIDTNGRIFLPRVGSVSLAGVRYGDLKEKIGQAIGTQYRGFTVNVGIKALRGVRVYVTGFANNPGSYNVNSLSTLANAVLAAGGPAAGGSFRTIQLIRNNEVIRKFDLYQLVLGGNKVNDAVLQNEDVIRIGPVGEEIAIAGSVNSEAIYEILPGETLETVLSFAGGPNSLADSSRLMLYRLSDVNQSGVQDIPRGQATSIVAKGGDIINLLSQGTLIRPTAKQSVLVRLEGEVEKPGNYVVPAGTPLGQVIEQAGGLTSRAFPYGTRLERQSVRLQQRQSYADAIQQLEFALAAAPLSGDRVGQSGDRQSQITAGREVVDRLKQSQPDGRVVLDIAPDARAVMSDLALETNDRILVPARPSTVGVFGAVYHPASFLFEDGKRGTIRAYLDRAGGPLKAGAPSEIFVVRASGEVLSKKSGAMGAKALPGDVVFVPVKAQASSLWSKIKDITSMIFQFGLSAATVVAVTK
jgi:polysaccharide export outer membrane protein